MARIKRNIIGFFLSVAALIGPWTGLVGLVSLLSGLDQDTGEESPIRFFLYGDLARQPISPMSCIVSGVILLLVFGLCVFLTFKVTYKYKEIMHTSLACLLAVLCILIGYLWHHSGDSEEEWMKLIYPLIASTFVCSGRFNHNNDFLHVWKLNFWKNGILAVFAGFVMSPIMAIGTGFILAIICSTESTSLGSLDAYGHFFFSAWGYGFIVSLWFCGAFINSVDINSGGGGGSGSIDLDDSTLGDIISAWVDGL